MSETRSLTALPVAWNPTRPHREDSRLVRFMRSVGISDYEAFLHWSVAEPRAFWDAVVRDLDLEFLQPYSNVLDVSAGTPWARWFVGGRYNYVHNALDKRLERPGETQPCLFWEGDDGESRVWSWARLGEETAAAASGLARLGIRPGDRVGLFLPMLPETVAALLALGRLGAVAVPVFSGFGAEAVAQRLRDSGASVLITADGALRRGKRVPMAQTAAVAMGMVPSLRHLVVVRRLGEGSAALPDAVGWDDMLSKGEDAVTRATDPEDPCLLLYTSGTTGRPKGAVHPHAGFPIKATQDMAHLFDVGQGDRLLWYTDLGWMMGPWAIIGSLTLGAACVLFEGTPDWPHPGRIWEVAERHGVTVLGIAPTAIRALMAHGNAWPRRYDLSALRILGSSGEPWNPGPWQWFLTEVGGGRCPLINYSGGTEVSGGILGCVPSRPLRPCGFNTVVPGIGAAVLNAEGARVKGEVGELCITAPNPGMTRGFWGDPQRYLDTYWSRFPGVWVHGDWALETEEGDWYILGRSDDTLNIAGKRVGPAEVESSACRLASVREAAAIGVPHPVKGEGVVVFVVPGADEPADELRDAVAGAVADDLGRALRPETVLLVEELPKTRNGKVLRRLIRQVHLGEPLGDLGSLERPESLEAIRRAR